MLLLPNPQEMAARGPRDGHMKMYLSAMARALRSGCRHAL
jgi:hypothetical protein